MPKAISKNRNGGNRKPFVAPPKQRGTGTQIAYEMIRSRIISLKLAPSADLDEADIVSELGLSRTPVREALIRLASERLVEMTPNRGARVAGMGLNHIREHLECYDLAQRTATRWAAMRRTETQLDAIRTEERNFAAAAAAGDVEGMIKTNRDFHSAIGAASGNASLQQFYDQLLTDALRIVRLAMSYEYYASIDAYQKHVATILSEHAEIVSHIAAKRAVEAEAIAHTHAELGRRRILDYMSINDSVDITIPS